MEGQKVACRAVAFFCGQRIIKEQVVSKNKPGACDQVKGNWTICWVLAPPFVVTSSEGQRVHINHATPELILTAMGCQIRMTIIHLIPIVR